ncbi:iron uptake transporter permease EfeU [Naasia lichenicola]|uniref:High-affinity Fe2+/Pb2+ permease n=1 Tax=Naasia lichenicola TaxID=2565933 RepID=A0A4S4FSX6_9MICO|nr:iron uptake transporter permease EfeU [Naasia lichenicola]THG32835.1 high-affinity Fe2+/Pb2+ permease [Naasia lichenicola]
MLANFLIGLREGLEIGLVVGILIAYINRVSRRDVLPKLWLGIGIAIALALAVGAILTWGPYGLSSQGQEGIGGVLSVLAVGLVTWMIFWMARNARELKGELHGALDKALSGDARGLVLLGVVAVGRESIETALFLWAAAKSETNTLLGTAGAIGGLAVAAALAYLIYRGAMRIDLRRFFFWTGLFLVLVAAGVLSYGLGELQGAGLVPGNGQAAFSVAGVIPPTSWYGSLLSGIFNFNAEPTWLQTVGWGAYLGIVLTLFLRASGVGRKAALQPSTSTAVAS